jgi:trans-aconitate methyltransferase
MDVNEMEFEEEFDVVFSNAALHWVKSRFLQA